jgi:hypothetical protein
MKFVEPICDRKKIAQIKNLLQEVSKADSGSKNKNAASVRRLWLMAVSSMSGRVYYSLS